MAVTTNDGAEVVTLPDARGEDYSVRISEASDGEPSDASDADFALGDAIVVLSPRGGETWPIGETRDVTWSSSGVTDVQVELSRDGGATWDTLAAAVPAEAATYAYPVTGPASSECLVRLSDADDGEPEGSSPRVFSIVAPASEGGGRDEDGGCGCRVGAPDGSAPAAAWLLLGALAGAGGVSRARRRSGRRP
ncbi:MAG TPA: MYXO-CTERM sorting domain-containing protein [Polyangiaceae bacterium]|nr:MYXO-CTERM sorting domain-containing protein [Polyangiaceae bacterium]